MYDKILSDFLLKEARISVFRYYASSGTSPGRVGFAEI